MVSKEPEKCVGCGREIVPGDGRYGIHPKTSATGPWCTGCADKDDPKIGGIECTIH